MQSWIGRGFVLLALAAVLLYVAWPVPEESSSSAAPTDPTAGDANSRMELVRLRGRIERLEADVTALRTQIDQSGHAHAPDGGTVMPATASGAPSAGVAAWQDALQRMRETHQESARDRWPDDAEGATRRGGVERSPADQAASEAQLAERREERLRRFAERVKLSDAQQDALQTALLTERDKMRELRTARQAGEDVGNWRAQQRQMRAETNRQMRDVLDEEQYQHYKRLRSGPRRGQRGRPAGRGRGRGRAPGAQRGR